MTLSLNVLKLLLGQEARPVEELELPVLHEPLEDGEAALVGPMEAVQDCQPALQGRLHQRSQAPHGVPLRGGRALLQQIPRRHVLHIQDGNQKMLGTVPTVLEQKIPVPVGTYQLYLRNIIIATGGM